MTARLIINPEKAAAAKMPQPINDESVPPRDADRAFPLGKPNELTGGKRTASLLVVAEVVKIVALFTVEPPGLGRAGAKNAGCHTTEVWKNSRCEAPLTTNAISFGSITCVVRLDADLNQNGFKNLLSIPI